MAVKENAISILFSLPLQVCKYEKYFSSLSTKNSKYLNGVTVTSALSPAVSKAPRNGKPEAIFEMLITGATVGGQIPTHQH